MFFFFHPTSHSAAVALKAGRSTGRGDTSGTGGTVGTISTGGTGGTRVMHTGASTRTGNKPAGKQ